MKKTKIVIICIVVFAILMLLVLNMNNRTIEMAENIRKSLYGNPIITEGNTNLINNKYFSISSDAKEAENTRVGINEAIEYAFKNNIEQIKFEKGNYLINLSAENIGIVLKSNLDIDFNGSTIILESNASTHASLFYLREIENVTLKNAIIKGDSNTHQFIGNSTHEWGYGLHIVNGNNINIYNLKIQECTGDGIIIDGKQSSDINISNCNISNCRRQGISITCGENIVISNNEIHDIKGTNPQSGIDLEAYQENQAINNIEIKQNKIYNLNSNIGIIIDRGTYSVNISENEIGGSVGVNCALEKAIINNNKLENGMINIYENEEKIQYGNKVNYVEIYSNEIYNSNIILSRINKSIIYENYIENGTIQLDSTNTAMYNNEIQNKEQKAKKYAYKYTATVKGNYIIYCVNNKEEGKFEEIVLNENEEYVLENRDCDDMNEYLNSIK